jgi:hypothetical protein
VTTDASVKSPAAGVADGDDVQGRVPVFALGERREGEAVDFDIIFWALIF